MIAQETQIRKVASVFRRMGYTVQVDVSKSTSSAYAHIGRPSRNGGLCTLATVRVSSHNKPGWSRAGWLSGMASKYYDSRDTSRRGWAKIVERVQAKLEVK